ncbi:MAG: HD domain-containing phosphohydrolase [Thermosulfidibacteraceae bacterium]|jgi:putative two-component system response regulator
MKGKILIVDDEEINVETLSLILSMHGYDVITATNGKRAFELFEHEKPDVVLLDLIMPEMSGIEVLEILSEKHDLNKTPIIVITALGDVETKKIAFEKGAHDFITKPFDKEDLLIRLNNALKLKNYHELIDSYNRMLEEEVEKRTKILKEAIHKLEKVHEELIYRLGKAAEYRDDDTGQHTKRVGLISQKIAETLGLNRERCRTIGLAAPMHDIGKIGIPDQILLKPGKLTVEEFEIIKKHTLIGYDILSGSEHPILICAANIALYHHEKWDGSGYPFGLSGEDIPIEARIVGIADFFDACTSDRVYRKALPKETVIGMINELSGIYFDPVIVEAFMNSFRDIIRIMEEFNHDSYQHNGSEKGRIYTPKR